MNHRTVLFDTDDEERYDIAMDIERAQESLRAAVACLREGYVNAAASRAYYAMFVRRESAV